MRIDANGKVWWNPFSWNWKAIGTIVLSGIALFGGIVLTVVTAGAASPILGLAGAVVGGALIGFGTGLGENMIAQVQTSGWQNVDYRKAYSAGGIGAVVGAISGFVSFAGAVVVSGYGSMAGFMLSKMSIAGLSVSKVFSASALIHCGVVAGRVIGGIGGAVLGEMIGENMFGNRYDFERDFRNTFGSVLIGWIGEFWKWFKNIV